MNSYTKEELSYARATQTERRSKQPHLYGGYEKE